jgi:hypothetical protein
MRGKGVRRILELGGRKELNKACKWVQKIVVKTIRPIFKIGWERQET